SVVGGLQSDAPRAVLGAHRTGRWWLVLAPRPRFSKAPALIEADCMRWHSNEGEAPFLCAAQNAPPHVVVTGSQVQLDVAHHDPVRATAPAPRREDQHGAADLVEQVTGAASLLPYHGRFPWKRHTQETCSLAVWRNLFRCNSAQRRRAASVA